MERQDDSDSEDAKESFSQSQVSREASSQSQNFSDGIGNQGGTFSQSREPQGAVSPSQVDSDSMGKVTSNNLSFVQAQLTEERDLGGQCLADGRPLSLVSSSHVGRFYIKTWVECFGPLPEPPCAPHSKPDHLSQGSQLSVSTLLIPKTLSFKGKAMSPKKKLSMRMPRRKLSKQKLVDGLSSPLRRNAEGKQRGIRDFFARIDGPIRASSGGRTQI